MIHTNRVCLFICIDSYICIHAYMTYHYFSTQGYHNVATKETGSNDCLLRGDAPASSHALYDSRLTAKGIAQSTALKDYLAKRPSGSRTFTAFDLVVVSPLTRTCETALHVFGQPREPGKPAFLTKEVR